jgi:hypothetical protein
LAQSPRSTILHDFHVVTALLVPLRCQLRNSAYPLAQDALVEFVLGIQHPKIHVSVELVKVSVSGHHSITNRLPEATLPFELIYGRPLLVFNVLLAILVHEAVEVRCVEAGDCLIADTRGDMEWGGALYPETENTRRVKVTVDHGSFFAGQLDIHIPSTIRQNRLLILEIPY